MSLFAFVCICLHIPVVDRISLSILSLELMRQAYSRSFLSHSSHLMDSFCNWICFVRELGVELNGNKKNMADRVYQMDRMPTRRICRKRMNFVHRDMLNKYAMPRRFTLQVKGEKTETISIYSFLIFMPMKCWSWRRLAFCVVFQFRQNSGSIYKYLNPRKETKS